MTATDPRSRFRRLVHRLRSTRLVGSSDRMAAIGPDLSDDERRLVAAEIDRALDPATAPETARTRAAEIGATFLSLSDTGKRRFFELLVSDYGVDDAAVDTLVERRRHTTEPVARSEADAALQRALEPARVTLLRYFNGLDAGVKFCVDMRADLRRVTQRDDGAARILDRELRTLLASWFDIGLLHLERITWQTSAAVLERLIAYEAVHDIASWDDLKRRLADDRRLYAFFHPGMPGEPLIFVEVALTVGLADAIEPLIDPSADVIDPADADTAIFYSISNCQPGLSGVPLGDFLIKRVVGELVKDQPQLRVFSTLSPLPGFVAWMHEQVATGALRHGEADVVAEILDRSSWWTDDAVAERARPVLVGLAARYLISARHEGRVIDPVARFHLSNGARIERLVFLANPTAVGQARSLGMMVNYRYSRNFIDANQEAYLNRNEVVASRRVRDLLAEEAAPRE